MRKVKWVMAITIIALISIVGYGEQRELTCVQAQGQSVQYTYDSLGRVETATYPGKMTLTYVYDKNGNICEIKKELLEENGGQSDATDKSETTQKPDTSVTNQIKNDLLNDPVILIDPGEWQPSMAEEVQAYNKFKKRTPVIKSLKQSKKKKKWYLKIQIKKLTITGDYPETGYQIQYATNKTFKKAKNVTVKRNKKKSVVSKQWTVKKKKTYYVRIRAYLVTKTGKKIYTKYSKVKKIKVKS